MPWRCAFDLVTTVSCLRGRPRASSNAIAHDPLDAGAGEDGGLGGDLIRQAAMRPPAMAGILALAVLAHDHPIQVARPDIAQRRGDAGQDARRADVGVLVEPLADRQPQSPQRDVVGDVGIADGAEIDRVRGAQPGHRVGRHEAAMLAVVVRAPVVVRHLQREAAVARGDRVEHLEPGADHLRANAVGGYRGDAVLGHGSVFRL